VVLPSREISRLEDIGVASNSARLKMKREERAKQFAPFAALKGFEEAIQAKEKVVAEAPYLTEDDKNALDVAVHTVKFGDIAKVKYYIDGEYIEKTGVVTRVDIDAGLIKIINTKIDLKDIYYLEIVSK